MTTVAEAVRHLKAHAGVSWEQMSRDLGVAMNSLFNWTDRQRPSRPRPSSLVKLHSYARERGDEAAAAVFSRQLSAVSRQPEEGV
jgi:hypothetical protein